MGRAKIRGLARLGRARGLVTVCARKIKSDQRSKIRPPCKPFAANEGNRIAAEDGIRARFMAQMANFWSLVCSGLHAHQNKLPEGDLMFESTVFQKEDQGTAEERLWRAVIAKTLEEWVCGPLRYSQKAEQFLFNDDKDFQAVCSSAGLDPRNLREKLEFIRARGIQRQIGRLDTTGPQPNGPNNPKTSYRLISELASEKMRKQHGADILRPR
jgi:hypothetical protein